MKRLVLMMLILLPALAWGEDPRAAQVRARLKVLTCRRAWLERGPATWDVIREINAVRIEQARQTALLEAILRTQQFQDRFVGRDWGGDFPRSWDIGGQIDIQPRIRPMPRVWDFGGQIDVVPRAEVTPRIGIGGGFGLGGGLGIGGGLYGGAGTWGSGSCGPGGCPANGPRVAPQGFAAPAPVPGGGSCGPGGCPPSVSPGGGAGGPPLAGGNGANGYMYYSRLRR